MPRPTISCSTCAWARSASWATRFAPANRVSTSSCSAPARSTGLTWSATATSCTRHVRQRTPKRPVHAFPGAGAQVEEGWPVLWREVLDGRIGEVQPVRDHFRRVFEDRLRLLGEARDLARFAERVAQRELPQAAQLEDEMESLESKL